MPRIWYSSYMNITDIWFLSTIKEFERQGIVFLVIFFLFLINVIKFLIKAALEEKSKLIKEFGLPPYLLTYEPNFKFGISTCDTLHDFAYRSLPNVIMERLLNYRKMLSDSYNITIVCPNCSNSLLSCFERKTSHLWNISHWTTSLKIGLYVAIGLTSLLIFTYAVATWFRGRSLQFQNDFESFALTHQEERRQLERQANNPQQLKKS